MARSGSGLHSAWMAAAILLAVALVATSSPPRSRRESENVKVSKNENEFATHAPEVDHNVTLSPSGTLASNVTSAGVNVTRNDALVTSGGSQTPGTPPAGGVVVPKPQKPKPLLATPKAAADPGEPAPDLAGVAGAKVQDAQPKLGPAAGDQQHEQQQQQPPGSNLSGAGGPAAPLHKPDEMPPGTQILNSFVTLAAEDETEVKVATEAPPAATFQQQQDLMDLLSFAASFGSDDGSKDHGSGTKEPQPEPGPPQGRSMGADHDDSLLVSKLKDHRQVCHPKDKDCNLKKVAAVDRRSMEVIDATLDPTSTVTLTTTTAATTTTKHGGSKEDDAEGLFGGIFKRLWWF